jgi:hypothetical protein
MNGERPGDYATVTQVASSATSVTLLEGHAGRTGFTVFNDSTAALYVKFGEGAASDSFTVKVGAGGYYEHAFPSYKGIVSGAWAEVNGFGLITEIS